MTYRIDSTVDGETNRISFSGVLDLAALDGVAAAVRAARRNGTAVSVLVLEAGTDVHRECIEPLRDIEGLRVVATSPFLARWLRQRGID